MPRRLTLFFVVLVVTMPLFTALSEETPLGLKPVKVPKDNPMTDAKVELGKCLAGYSTCDLCRNW